MGYSESDITPVEPLPWIRAHPSMFFAGGAVSAAALLDCLRSGAMAAGADRVDDEIRGTWAFSMSSPDWLPQDDIPGLFTHMIWFPASGNNDIRPEVLLGAFCRCVCTLGPDKELVVVPDGDIPQEVRDRIDELAGNFERIFAFTM
jgi:hypothetical protein